MLHYRECHPWLWNCRQRSEGGGWGGNILKGRMNSSFTLESARRSKPRYVAAPGPAPWDAECSGQGGAGQSESWLSLITAFLPARVSNPGRHSIVTFVTGGPECDEGSRGNITEALSDNKVIRQGMELSWWDQLSSGTQATISAVHVSAPVPATAALTNN